MVHKPSILTSAEESPSGARGVVRLRKTEEMSAPPNFRTKNLPINLKKSQPAHEIIELRGSQRAKFLMSEYQSQKNRNKQGSSSIEAVPTISLLNKHANERPKEKL